MCVATWYMLLQNDETAETERYKLAHIYLCLLCV